MTTVTKNVKISGVGMHLGLPVNMVVKPSQKPGIFFRRIDLPNSELIPATFDNVCDTMMRSTQIGKKNGASVRTIEHLMAVLFVLGIDSAVIEIDGPEVPFLDGSAFELYRLLEKFVSDKTKMRKIVVKKTVEVKSADLIKTLPFWQRIKAKIFSRRITTDGFVKIEPYADGLLIDAVLDYDNKIIGTQSYSFVMNDSKASVKEFVEDIAKTRSFGGYAEWEWVKKHGVGLGCNLHNVIAINARWNATINKLYYPDEFVRHKIIDALGDMFTSGGFIYGWLQSYKGSHALNNLVLRKLFSDKSNYEIVDVKGEKK